jgi:hypothetical protein
VRERETREKEIIRDSGGSAMQPFRKNPQAKKETLVNLEEDEEKKAGVATSESTRGSKSKNFLLRNMF